MRKRKRFVEEIDHDHVIALDDDDADGESSKDQKSTTTHRSKKSSTSQSKRASPPPTLRPNTVLRKYLGQLVLPDLLYSCVQQHGGHLLVDRLRKWSAIRQELNLPDSTSGGNRIKAAYHHYFLDGGKSAKKNKGAKGSRGSKHAAEDECVDGTGWRSWHLNKKFMPTPTSTLSSTSPSSSNIRTIDAKRKRQKSKKRKAQRKKEKRLHQAIKRTQRQGNEESARGVTWNNDVTSLNCSENFYYRHLLEKSDEIISSSSSSEAEKNSALSESESKSDSLESDSSESDSSESDSSESDSSDSEDYDSYHSSDDDDEEDADMDIGGIGGGTTTTNGGEEDYENYHMKENDGLLTKQSPVKRRRASSAGSSVALQVLFKGVYPQGKKFVSKILIRGRIRHIGTFRTAIDAALGYDYALLAYGKTTPKEIPQFNFPTIKGSTEDFNNDLLNSCTSFTLPPLMSKHGRRVWMKYVQKCMH